jgi:hypothetical protein
LGGNIRWGRPFGLEAELEMAGDLIDGFRIFDKRDDSHLASTGRTKQTILILSKELLKIIKEHSIENRVFRMTLAVNPCHGSRDDSRNGPGSRKEPQRPDTPGMLQS